MPVRFTTPSLGGQGELQVADRAAHQWRLAVGYRHLHADQLFVGTQLLATNQPLIINLHSVDVTTSYAVTDRFSLSLTVPFVDGMQSRMYADSARHAVTALGLGDVSLIGSTWLLDPHNHSGNIALGLGVKAPTGTHTATDAYFLKGGTSIQYPVDQSIEPGDAGWGIVLQLQAYRRAFHNAIAYLTGSYLANPRRLSDVAKDPGGTVYWSVPDVYSARLGLAYALWPQNGLSVSLGGRIDGQPVRDLIGGGDAGFRRPGYAIALDPSVSLTTGPSQLTVSAPIRLSANRQASVLDLQTGKHGGGDLASTLIFVGYWRRSGGGQEASRPLVEPRRLSATCLIPLIAPPRPSLQTDRPHRQTARPGARVAPPSQHRTGSECQRRSAPARPRSPSRPGYRFSLGRTHSESRPPPRSSSCAPRGTTGDWGDRSAGSA